MAAALRRCVVVAGRAPGVYPLGISIQRPLVRPFSLPALGFTSVQQPAYHAVRAQPARLPFPAVQTLQTMHGPACWQSPVAVGLPVRAMGTMRQLDGESDIGGAVLSVAKKVALVVVIGGAVIVGGSIVLGAAAIIGGTSLAVWWGMKGYVRGRHRFLKRRGLVRVRPNPFRNPFDPPEIQVPEMKSWSYLEKMDIRAQRLLQHAHRGQPEFRTQQAFVHAVALSAIQCHPEVARILGSYDADSYGRDREPLGAVEVGEVNTIFQRDQYNVEEHRIDYDRFEVDLKGPQGSGLLVCEWETNQSLWKDQDPESIARNVITTMYFADANTGALVDLIELPPEYDNGDGDSQRSSRSKHGSDKVIDVEYDVS